MVMMVLSPYLFFFTFLHFIAIISIKNALLNYIFMYLDLALILFIWALILICAWQIRMKNLVDLLFLTIRYHSNYVCFLLIKKSFHLFNFWTFISRFSFSFSSRKWLMLFWFDSNIILLHICLMCLVYWS